jgi:hypothetical protein
MRLRTPRHLGRRLGVAAVLILISAHAVHASGFLYRSAATGRWTNLASIGDPLPPDSAFASETFGGLVSSRAPIATVAAGTCGPDAITLAAFTASVSRKTSNTGIFLFEAATASIHDVAIEATATPLGGTWDAFAGNPDLAIDADTCVAHVVFRGHALGGDPSRDTGVFDATFTLPGLASAGVTVLAQEGVTTPGLPFPPTAVLSEVAPQVSLAVFDSPGVGVVTGFPIRVIDDAVTSDNDTGILAIGPGGPSALLREGDPSCAPAWTDAGPVYDEFPDTRPLSMSALGGTSVFLEAHSRGGAVNGALVLNTGGCSGSTLVVATDGGPAPGGGTISLLWRGLRPLDVNASGVAGFAASTSGGNSIIRSTTGIVAQEWLANTSLGPAAQLRGVGSDLAMNSTSDLVFSAGVYLHSHYGGMFFAGASGGPLELLNFGGVNPQIDDLGNMTALF